MNAGLSEIEKLLNDYRNWLKDRTTLRQVNGEWVEITTPYLDRHNDAMQIYARRADAGFVLSDDRYTIHDLEASGCTLNTEKRQDLLKMTLNGFGVKLNNEALEVQATAESFPARKHNLIQAMLAVNDRFFLAKPIVESLFFEDVVAWLDANEIRYTPRPGFPGISGYHQFFGEKAQSFIYAWNDTRPTRAPESKAYGVLNDAEQPISGGVMEALRNYQIEPVPWSRRAEVVTELAA